VEAIPTDQGAVSTSATKAVPPISYRHAVSHLLTSVVREICMLRSVGGRGADNRPRPPGGAPGNWHPYRDHQTRIPRVADHPRTGSYYDKINIEFVFGLNSGRRTHIRLTSLEFGRTTML